MRRNGYKILSHFFDKLGMLFSSTDFFSVLMTIQMTKLVLRMVNEWLREKIW